MQMALALAERGLYSTTPNPRVGCVIVKSGAIIGQGWHQQAGGPHAEVFALREAGSAAKDATAYVTLEPCSHFGKTPPCADALIQAEVKRVVIAMTDPNPLVAGKGVQRLIEAGIEVQTGLLEEQARELNCGFISRMVKQRPWIRIKTAISLDGFTALPNGTSQWITGPEARQDGHHWRARACAILSGIGTVLHDNPMLNVRGIETPRQPLKVIVDSQLRIASDARLLDQNTLLVHSQQQDVLDTTLQTKYRELQAKGVEFVSLAVEQQHTPATATSSTTTSTPTIQANTESPAHDKVNLQALMTLLAKRGINEVHVEAGNTLTGALIAQGLFDELLVYQAPCLLGQGKGFAALPLPEQLDEKITLRRIDCAPIGNDLRMRFVKQ